MAFHKGELFESFDEFEVKLNAFQASSNVPFSRKSSKKGLLTKYGYLKTLPHDTEDAFMSDEYIKEGIRSFQSFNGLEVTGLLDNATMTKMDSPRCGVVDIEPPPEEPTLNGQRPSLFSLLGSTWRRGSTITWRLARFSAKLSEGEQMASFGKALDLWSRVIPNTFRYSRHYPDIEIKFAKGAHGDGSMNDFDGKNGVLAHAFNAGSRRGGDTHFDEDEDWSVNTGRGTDLTTVAAHEFGHALGLGHSSVSGALMAPYYRYKGEVSLHADDIWGIRVLYGYPHVD